MPEVRVVVAVAVGHRGSPGGWILSGSRLIYYWSREKVVWSCTYEVNVCTMEATESAGHKAEHNRMPQNEEIRCIGASVSSGHKVGCGLRGHFARVKRSARFIDSHIAGAACAGAALNAA